MPSFAKKSLIVFDLDGTLTPSKSPMEPSMVRALTRLLEKKRVVVIGGGGYRQFKKQFITKAKFPKHLLGCLYVFPVSGTAFYKYDHGWKKVYARDFSLAEKKKIFDAFRKTFREAHYQDPPKVYGRVIEDRGSQITFSAVGQDVVEMLGVRRGVAVKEKWNWNFDVRPKLMRILKRFLPQFTIRRGGLTSIDITKLGIDKAYGLRQIEKELGIPIKNMLFIGDALYPGGNDAAVKKTGVQTIAVRGPKDTIGIIKKIVKSP